MKDVSFLTKQLIAHRGYHDIKKGIPENSLLAFKRAIRYNYAIELDVHLLKDNNLAVFHDYDLNRVCGVDKIIENCNYEELKKYFILNTKEKILLLNEVLELVDGKVPLLIEIKNVDGSGNLEKKLSEMLDNYNGYFAVQSFNILSIKWFKNNRTNYVRGLLASNNFDNNVNNLKRILCKTLIFDIYLKTDFIAYNIKSLPNIYASNIRKKKALIGWTIETKAEYDRALLYCDQIICEKMDKYV